MEIVWLWELIKHGIKNKKIERKSTLTPSAKKNIPSRKKKGDTHAIFTNQQSVWQAFYVNQPSYATNHLPPTLKLQ